MTEEKGIYETQTQGEKLTQGTLEPFASPNYHPPKESDVRLLLRIAGLTGAEAGKLVGVDARSVRRWCAPPDTSNHRPIPYSAWRLLLIEAGLVPGKQNIQEP
ncbi:hypothetical protein [Hahella chejuensis]|uniref:hypothetical protein n=1 Tax=Hahella chejuensis TaxID=158327 RepID=UPI000306FFAB|nr:hypothetical protein [Hahella chejuensis]